MKKFNPSTFSATIEDVNQLSETELRDLHKIYPSRKSYLKIAYGKKDNNLGSTGYAAPKIYFESDKISYGQEAEDLSESLKERVYAYLFNGEFGTPKQKKKSEEVDPDQTNLLYQVEESENKI